MAARDRSLSRGSKWVRALPAKYQVAAMTEYVRIKTASAPDLVFDPTLACRLVRS